MTTMLKEPAKQDTHAKRGTTFWRTWLRRQGALVINEILTTGRLRHEDVIDIYLQAQKGEQHETALEGTGEVNQHQEVSGR